MNNSKLFEIALSDNQVKFALLIAEEEELITHFYLQKICRDNNQNNINLKYIIESCDAVNIENKFTRINELTSIYYHVFSNNYDYIYYRIIPIKDKNKLRCMIGKWNPPALSQRKISEVVDDIYEKVIFQNEGEYVYWNGGSTGTHNGKKEYHLIIDKSICLFFNNYRKTIFRIVYTN